MHSLPSLLVLINNSVHYDVPCLSTRGERCYWHQACNFRLPNISYTTCLFIYFLFIYLFGVLCHFQHCTGHITTGSWKGRGNQYIQFARVVYCKLPTNGKQLPAFPLKAMTGIEPRPQRWEAPYR